MTKNLLLAQVLGFLVGGSLCVADDGSARRYAQLSEHDDLDRMFSLLVREDVQDELKVTPEQVAKVRHICHAPDQEVPGLPELVASYKNRQSDTALSELDRTKLKHAFEADLESRINEYQKRGLSSTLSESQRQRLAELVIQMRGPIAIVDDAAVSSKLRLSDEQAAKINENTKEYEGELKWLLGRYGRQQLSGPRYEGETKEDRKKELEALFTVMRAIERERDSSLLPQLTPEQLELWTTIQGIPLSISWSPTSLYDSPFEE